MGYLPRLDKRAYAAVMTAYEDTLRTGDLETSVKNAANRFDLNELYVRQYVNIKLNRNRYSILPYITDQNMSDAVCAACELIRNTGWFWTAIEKYSVFYDVDPDELTKLVRVTQSNGQQLTNARKTSRRADSDTPNQPNKKLRYFAVEFSQNEDGKFTYQGARYVVIHGKSRETVISALMRRKTEKSIPAKQKQIGRIRDFSTEKAARSMADYWETHAPACKYA